MVDEGGSLAFRNSMNMDDRSPHVAQPGALARAPHTRAPTAAPTADVPQLSVWYWRAAARARASTPATSPSDASQVPSSRFSGARGAQNTRVNVCVFNFNTALAAPAGERVRVRVPPKLDQRGQEWASTEQGLWLPYRFLVAAPQVGTHEFVQGLGLG